MFIGVDPDPTGTAGRAGHLQNLLRKIKNQEWNLTVFVRNVIPKLSQKAVSMAPSDLVVAHPHLKAVMFSQVDVLLEVSTIIRAGEIREICSTSDRIKRLFQH